ncbi:MAG TPA: antibiotic biosynthesis monooxygenase [Gemmatimonadales bacterium]|nr:antibiotic biosynthesis monooxygenase [Gemmatimonadales bacterium]
MNYIRNVTFQIKPGKSAEFSKIVNNEILPVMKQQPGFKHELAIHNATTAVGLSVWQDKPSAEKYHTMTYPEVLQKLSTVIEGTPRVENYELAATTLMV